MENLPNIDLESLLGLRLRRFFGPEELEDLVKDCDVDSWEAHLKSALRNLPQGLGNSGMALELLDMWINELRRECARLYLEDADEDFSAAIDNIGKHNRIALRHLAEGSEKAAKALWQVILAYLLDPLLDYMEHKGCRSQVEELRRNERIRRPRKLGHDAPIMDLFNKTISLLLECKPDPIELLRHYTVVPFRRPTLFLTFFVEDEALRDELAKALLKAAQIASTKGISIKDMSMIDVRNLLSQLSETVIEEVKEEREGTGLALLDRVTDAIETLYNDLNNLLGRLRSKKCINVNVADVDNAKRLVSVTLDAIDSVKKARGVVASELVGYLQAAIDKIIKDPLVKKAVKEAYSSPEIEELIIKTAEIALELFDLLYVTLAVAALHGLLNPCYMPSRYLDTKDSIPPGVFDEETLKELYSLARRLVDHIKGLHLIPREGRGERWLRH